MNHPAACELACGVATFLHILHVISFYLYVIEVVSASFCGGFSISSVQL